MTIMSFASFGYEGEIIKVEADLRRGLPIVDIVGLPGSAVKEARERMRAAIGNSDLPFPQERILINLSPADQKKEGSGFDLPIALAVLQADCALDMPVMVIGELELSGRVRPVRGVLGALISGAAAGIGYFIVPKENEAEARIQQGVHIYGVETLREALECLYAIETELRMENNSESNTGEKTAVKPQRRLSTTQATRFPQPLHGRNRVKRMPRQIRGRAAFLRRCTANANWCGLCTSQRQAGTAYLHTGRPAAVKRFRCSALPASFPT